MKPVVICNKSMISLDLKWLPLPLTQLLAAQAVEMPAHFSASDTLGALWALMCDGGTFLCADRTSGLPLVCAMPSGAVHAPGSHLPLLCILWNVTWGAPGLCKDVQRARIWHQTDQQTFGRWEHGSPRGSYWVSVVCICEVGREQNSCLCIYNYVFILCGPWLEGGMRILPYILMAECCKGGKAIFKFQWCLFVCSARKGSSEGCNVSCTSIPRENLDYVLFISCNFLLLQRKLNKAN